MEFPTTETWAIYHVFANIPATIRKGVSYERKEFIASGTTATTFLSDTGGAWCGDWGRAAITIPVAKAQSVGGARWEAARHEQDDWLDKVPGKHRLVFDTIDSNGMSSALLYAGNYYTANRTGYGLQNNDLAVVIIARHFSTAYAYNEALWAKYGDQLSNSADSTKPPSKTNTYAR